MHLEKVEIQGFKSFASKTSISLDRGITAIVGPNGSGKSNVADAIRWVMGEQSMKNLRGKKSEDIIFAGSNIKGKMGMAEVSLHLNNEDGQVPIDYSQVVLTRRLYRSGESEYLLNKSKVRLLDIHELLAQAGFGQKTYSVIGQGMIDAILRAGPKERREMFEEAAGIKHFQMKRNSSINKLVRTKQNLSRVGDLLTEIGPRRNSLKRQANKAQKKDEIRKELKILQEEYFNHLWNKNKQGFDQVQSEGDEYGRKEKEIEKEINSIKLKLNQAEEDTDYSKEDELINKLSQINIEKNNIREKLAMIEGRIEAASEKDFTIGVGDFNKSQHVLEEEKKVINDDLKMLVGQKDVIEKNIQNNSEEIDNIEKNKQEFENELGEIQENAELQGMEGLKKDINHLNQIQSSFFDQLQACRDLAEFEVLKESAQGIKADINEVIVGINKKASGDNLDQNKLKTIQENIGKAIQARIKFEQNINDYKIKLAVIETKINSGQDLLDQKEKELKEVIERIKNFASQDTGENTILKQLLLDKEVWQRKFEAIEDEVKRANENITSERQKEREARKELFVMEKDYRSLQEKLNNIRNSHNQNQIRAAKIENDKQLLLDEIMDNTSETEYLRLQKIFMKKPVEVELEREQELNIKISKLRKQVIAIGEIDPEVVSEYEECDERFTYLSEQKEDLEKAMESLKKVIVELDETINEKFDEAFKNINIQFQKYFEVLFGGGKAKLMKRKVLIKDTVEGDEEEPEGNGQVKNTKEEEQIEILATPPGKKLKNLGMLSGGERALTSIALLFAIITNNPAPFMVLDEVDAALDESNSSRYADIVTSLADKSQFIIITHNRETMRRAKLLYGVTMEQSGISKLLSVKLDNLPNN